VTTCEYSKILTKRIVTEEHCEYTVITTYNYHLLRHTTPAFIYFYRTTTTVEHSTIMNNWPPSIDNNNER
jgi:hypothetical protein